VKIFVKKIDGITLPKKATEVSAGYDIIATSEPKIVGDSDNDDSKRKFWRSIDYIEYETNLFISPQLNSVHTLIHPRSSISKYDLVLANSIGLIDNDYRGMVICRFKYIWQPSDLYQYKNALVGSVREDKIYKRNDAIAQLVFEPTIQVEFELVDDLDKTERGEGGFGSTTDKISEHIKIHPKPAAAKVSLTDIYNKAGGIAVKEKYSEEIKRREQ
jgi:dUTPase